MIEAPYSIAGAFLVGGVLGFIACIRLFRIVLEYLRDRNKD